MMLRAFLALAVVMCTLGFAAAQDYDPKLTPKILPMPKGLLEISGLAVASDNSVFAHNDEHGIVYEISIETGDIMRAFAMGDPTIAADFEGIATTTDRIYLITSKGILYESLIGAHQSRVKFNAYDTGVGSNCEVEGLANGPIDEAGWASFLILCKSPRQPELKDRLTIYQWSLLERRPVTEPWLSVDRDEILLQSEQKKFKPAGLEWQAKTERLFVISGGNRQFLQLTSKGDKISNFVLSDLHHSQTEGLAIMPDGALVFADEGSRAKPGSLSIYKAKP